MTEAAKPSLVVSLFAALLAPTGVVLGFGLFAMTATEVAQAWNEGGWGMYAISLCAMAAAVTSAVAAFFAAQGKPLVWGASAALLLGTWALGVFSYRSDMSGAYEAIQHASPADRVMT